MKKYLIKYKWQNLLLFLLLFIINSVTTGLAFVQMYIGKQVIEGNFIMVMIAVSASAALAFFNSFLLYIRKNFQAHLIAQMNQDFRNQISDKIIREPYDKLNQTDTGEYLSWYTNDVREAENQGFQVFYNCLDEALKLILGAISLLFIRWEILLLTLVVSGISLYISRRLNRKVETYANNVSVALERYTDRVKEQIAGSRPYFAKGEWKSEAEEICEMAVLPALENEITVKNLSFSYGEKQVLKDINLTFRRGEKYAIVGKSGCGKTTLLKLMLGQLTGYQGSILYDKKELSCYDINTFYEQMAYIEQNVFLFDTSIRNNITLGDSYCEDEIDKVLKMSALEEDIRTFPEGLDTKVGENGKNLSGEQKQRIAVARALIHDRKILLVDEGTSALDQENALIIEHALLNCPELTLILIIHHLKEEYVMLYENVYRL